ncbi:hypothetical protein B0H14DRAFT_3501793 [Mycena olivaceomarginata]|nr:hypothetical protein B0H14DRAFT_3501793 [Mycena olivaceomarginata]
MSSMARSSRDSSSPLDPVFPVGAADNDLVWLDVLANACKGEVCLQSAKALFMGPDSALEADGYHKGRAGKASIIGMKTFTRRAISWVITQVQFVMSAKQDGTRRTAISIKAWDQVWGVLLQFIPVVTPNCNGLEPLPTLRLRSAEVRAWEAQPSLGHQYPFQDDSDP